MSRNSVYIAIDLKSFYASVECVSRGLDPLTTNLVVADSSRTEKTICLAVSPSLKAWGISGRARLFEVVQRVSAINEDRRRNAPGRRLKAPSSDDRAVKADPSIAVGYITAPPRMSLYMETSSRVYDVYLKYVAQEDIHVYSVDEVFMDVTDYMKTYGCTPRELAMRMIRDVLSTTGITATAGIGTNLYLAKVAMDIDAKHQVADADGVRIAELDEMSYRRRLWGHTPLRDFWRVGGGIASKLETVGIKTMGQLARCSLDPRWEDYLYGLFGVNAELLIDHAWGWEPCTMKEIKAYRPSSNSISSGQVLKCPYTFEKGRLIAMEMADRLSLDLVEKRLVTNQIMLNVGYDTENADKVTEKSEGAVVEDRYGRKVPKPSHGSINLGRFTSSTDAIVKAVGDLYDRIVSRKYTIRRLSVTANHATPESEADLSEQLSLFEEPKDDRRERRRQEAIIAIQKKWGRNAILKGMNFEEGATMMERNGQIGGHKA